MVPFFQLLAFGNLNGLDALHLLVDPVGFFILVLLWPIPFIMRGAFDKMVLKATVKDDPQKGKQDDGNGDDAPRQS